MQPFQNSFGTGFKSSTHIVFFGGVGSSNENLKKEFQNLNFKTIKQTHSDIVVSAADLPVEADAHFTDQINTAVVVATADCIPLMIYCKQTHRVAAVHAGWKGVQNQIVVKTLLRLIDSGSAAKDFVIYIGPHIMQESFEIQTDVFQLLAAANPGLEPAQFSLFKNEKFYVNLLKLVKFQIRKITGTSVGLVALNIDTKISTNYYSYRRGKHGTDRNLSFITLL